MSFGTAVLPSSFNYRFSKLTTTFHVGASVVLRDYLLPLDVLALLLKAKITGLAAAQLVWIQAAALQWPVGRDERLRGTPTQGSRGRERQAEAAAGGCGQKDQLITTHARCDAASVD